MRVNPRRCPSVATALFVLLRSPAPLERTPSSGTAGHRWTIRHAAVLPTLPGQLPAPNCGCPLIDDYLASAGISLREVIIATLDSLDVDAYLQTADLGDEDLAALRARLLSPAT
ncbi:MAG: hypothetical protein ACRDRY_18995 [Pseudonocardiaceae bacterium]